MGSSWGRAGDAAIPSAFLPALQSRALRSVALGPFGVLGCIVEV